MSSAVSPFGLRRHVSAEGEATGVRPSPPKVPPPRPPPGAPKARPSPAGMLFSKSQSPQPKNSEIPNPVTPQESLTPRGTVRKLLTPFVRSNATVFTVPANGSNSPERQSPVPTRKTNGPLSKVIPSAPSQDDSGFYNSTQNDSPQKGRSTPGTTSSPLKTISSRSQLPSKNIQAEVKVNQQSSLSAEVQSPDFNVVVVEDDSLGQASRLKSALALLDNHDAEGWEAVSPFSKKNSNKSLAGADFSGPVRLAEEFDELKHNAVVSSPSKGLAIETKTPAMSSDKCISTCFDVYEDPYSKVEAQRPLDLSSLSPERRSPSKSTTSLRASLETTCASSTGLSSRKTSAESETLPSAAPFDSSRKTSTSSDAPLSRVGSTSSLANTESRSSVNSRLPPPPPARISSPKRIGPLPRVKFSLADFDFGVTLGTGSFGRVRFARFNNPRPGTNEIRTRLALKILRKDAVKKLNQVEHIQNEKSILHAIATIKEPNQESDDGNNDEHWLPGGRHPFIVHLFGTFQTQTCLFMVMEFIRGGEFFCHLRMRGHFKNHEAMFYTASVASVFAYLHARDIAYRDLKPENLMLDHEGFVKVVDFGFAKYIPDNKTFTLCGTPEYIAPEVLVNKGHGMGVDWWALGILTYEMLSGVAPFTDSDPMVIYQRIVRGNVQYPTYFDPDARSFLRRLLQVDLSKRYGCLANGARDVVEHRWLADIDFSLLLKRALTPPFVPETKDIDDTSCFEEYPESKDIDLDGVDAEPYTGGGDFPYFDVVCT